MVATRFIDNSGVSTTHYQPIYDDNQKLIKENVFTNILNVLGYIPGISTISGIARIIFAAIMLLKTADDDHATIRHYKNHITRGGIEVSPVVINNIILIAIDIFYAIFLKYKEISLNESNEKNTEYKYNL